MKLVKIGLKRLNTKEFNSIKDKVQMIRDKLAAIQIQMRDINQLPELLRKVGNFFLNGGSNYF